MMLSMLKAKVGGAFLVSRGFHVQLDDPTIPLADEVSVDISPLCAPMAHQVVQYSYESHDRYPAVVVDRKLDVVKLIQRQLHGLVIAPKCITVIHILGDPYICKFSRAEYEVTFQRTTTVRLLDQEVDSDPQFVSNFQSIWDEIYYVIHFRQIKGHCGDISHGGLIEGRNGSGKTMLLRQIYTRSKLSSSYDSVFIDGLLLGILSSENPSACRLTEIYER